eukprot:5369501-Alexandrium_andersonii.AAC.1
MSRPPGRATPSESTEIARLLARQWDAVFGRDKQGDDTEQNGRNAFVYFLAGRTQVYIGSTLENRSMG